MAVPCLKNLIRRTDAAHISPAGATGCTSPQTETLVGDAQEALDRSFCSLSDTLTPFA